MPNAILRWWLDTANYHLASCRHDARYRAASDTGAAAAELACGTRRPRSGSSGTNRSTTVCRRTRAHCPTKGTVRKTRGRCAAGRRAVRCRCPCSADRRPSDGWHTRHCCRSHGAARRERVSVRVWRDVPDAPLPRRHFAPRHFAPRHFARPRRTHPRDAAAPMRRRTGRPERVFVRRLPRERDRPVQRPRTGPRRKGRGKGRGRARPSTERRARSACVCVGRRGATRRLGSRAGSGRCAGRPHRWPAMRACGARSA